MIRGKDVVWVVWEERGMKGRLKVGFQTTFLYLCSSWAKPTLRVVWLYSGLNLNQDKATKPQTVQIVRQGEATPYWFKVNPL